MENSLIACGVIGLAKIADYREFGFLPHLHGRMSRWFSSDGVLKEDQRAAWCQNALPRVETFDRMSTNTARENIEVSALLSQTLYTTLHANKCMDDDAYLSRMNGLYERGARETRVQSFLEMFKVQPILGIMAKAKPQIVERLVYSPNRMCQHHALKNGNETVGACDRFVDDRPATLKDLANIKNSDMTRALVSAP